MKADAVREARGGHRPQGELELEIEAIGGDINDDDGEASETRFAVLKETLRETKATGARLTEQLSGARAREALRASNKRKSRQAAEALQEALEEAQGKLAVTAEEAAGAKSSDSPSTEVWDGEPGPRGPHIAAIKETSKALLGQVALQLKQAKTMACRPGPRGVTRKTSISELTSMLATLEGK